MAFKIFITERAQTNIDDPVDYYEFKSENLGKRFYNDFLSNLKYIVKDPYLFAIREFPFREYPLSTFPFLIIYDIVGDTVVIASVFNTAKNPRKKPTRL
ncbi:type II toxin-antitoxin system RelE/ParE family toxin [Flavobacterium sp. RHBU_24]|uniref:type II toxin-antitoxin system RelE/ParE family toxin n=1 Tax=Flavobacterium sp. RHBU_24 TaxID=3391185 RepID=UPI00398530A9